MWLKDPEDLHQNQVQDHQNHPLDHQNRLQGLRTSPISSPPKGGLLRCRVLKPLKPSLVVLGVVLVVLELVLM